MLNNEENNLFIKNSIYFGRLCHHQKLHGTPDDGILTEIYGVIYKQMLSHFVKPPSDTLE
jgi:hypothetical protein